MVFDSILERAGDFLEMGDGDDRGICELLILVVDDGNVDENGDEGADSFFRFFFCCNCYFLGGKTLLYHLFFRLRVSSHFWYRSGFLVSRLHVVGFLIRDWLFSF